MPDAVPLDVFGVAEDRSRGPSGVTQGLIDIVCGETGPRSWLHRGDKAS